MSPDRLFESLHRPFIKPYLRTVMPLKMAAEKAVRSRNDRR